MIDERSELKKYTKKQVYQFKINTKKTLKVLKKRKTAAKATEKEKN